MNLKSIRWRLPLSYAGISLLAVLALGLVLIAILRGYYGRQEREFLQGNAKWIGGTVTSLMQADAPAAMLNDQVVNWSFVLQARIQVLDKQGQVIADSGLPDVRQVLMVSKDAFIQMVSLPGVTSPTLRVASGGVFFLSTKQSLQGQEFVLPPGCTQDMLAEGTTAQCQGPVSTRPVIRSVTIGTDAGGTTPVTDTLKQSPLPDGGMGIVMSLASSPFGFKLDGASDTPVRHSNQSVDLPIADAAGQALGTVVLSDGPAAGQDLVDNVLRGWAVAGAVAVLLAGAAGWLVSRQMTAPLLALTGATQQMAAGDLSARAAIHADDEFGQLAGSFNDMAKRVEETVQTLRQFVGDAAHELHTPLTALRTDLELAADDQHPGQQAGLIAEALRQAARLETTINGLLDLSRLEAPSSAHTPVDLNALAGEVGDLYASRAEQADLQWKVEPAAEGVAALGDRAQLLRAVGNLVDNALKFTPPGGTVSLRLVANGPWALLTVTDTGIGIPADDLPRITERFHRGRNAAEYPGSGLGLAIVKAIAAAHRGVVTIENVETGGTRCTLRLPKAVL